jgi:hypothetical protein
MIYKVSYVVSDGGLPGGIKNETERPTVGKTVRIGPNDFEVVEVHEIMPGRGDFHYLHATIEPVPEEEMEI